MIAISDEADRHRIGQALQMLRERHGAAAECADAAGDTDQAAYHRDEESELRAIERVVAARGCRTPRVA